MRLLCNQSFQCNRSIGFEHFGQEPGKTSRFFSEYTSLQKFRPHSHHITWSPKASSSQASKCTSQGEGPEPVLILIVLVSVSNTLSADFLGLLRNVVVSLAGSLPGKMLRKLTLDPFRHHLGMHINICVPWDFRQNVESLLQLFWCGFL